ncbi:phosphotransferase family protein [Acidocella sp.]|uniref:phosphotransferase family protein n=1 Tax=Acidocella sp. TaxID=50710 RepID=UPI003D02C77C
MTARPSAPFEARAQDALAHMPGWAGHAARLELAAPPVASPLHRAVASDCVLAQTEGRAPLFLKLRHTDMREDILPWAEEAARLAAKAGVAPDVMLARPGVLGLAYLPPPWRYARMGDLQAPQALAAVLAAKKRLHGGERLGRRFCPFTRIETLTAEAMAAGVIMPEDTGHLLRGAALIREAVRASGIDLAFCHNEAAASNIMLNGGEVRLVDFDLAADNDPWYDVGALINEVCDFDPPRRAAVEMYAGRYEERLFNRCRLYGAVDDLMWGLWGLVRAVTSPRETIEFWKYGTWRLLHARTTIGSRDFELWLRRL